MPKLSIFFNICSSLHGTKKGHHHLGMTSTKGTDAKNLSESIIDIINKFNLEKKLLDSPVMVELI